MGDELLLLLPGFLCGLFLWMQFLRWFALIHVTVAKEGGDFLGPPKRRLVWATPLVAALHPAPWLISGIAFAGVLSFRDDTATRAHGFFVALGVGVLIQALGALLTLRRIRRAR